MAFLDPRSPDAALEYGELVPERGVLEEQALALAEGGAEEAEQGGHGGHRADAGGEG